LGKFCENTSCLSFQSLQLDQIGVDFIRSLLVPIPRDRSSAQQALNHQWMLVGR
jgi:hypothetical protein